MRRRSITLCYINYLRVATPAVAARKDALAEVVRRRFSTYAYYMRYSPPISGPTRRKRIVPRRFVRRDKGYSNDVAGTRERESWIRVRARARARTRKRFVSPPQVWHRGRARR